MGHGCWSWVLATGAAGREANADGGCREYSAAAVGCPAALALFCPRACSLTPPCPARPARCAALCPLRQVQEALSLGRATLGKIRQNLGWALFYNLVGIPLAAGALLPGWGVALDPAVAGGMVRWPASPPSSFSLPSSSLFSLFPLHFPLLYVCDRWPLPRLLAWVACAVGSYPPPPLPCLRAAGT